MPNAGRYSSDIGNMRLCICGFAIASLLMAAGKPDFSGEWKIDPKASKTAPFPPPQTQTLSVVHRDPELSVEQRTATGLPRVYKYKTNGERTENISPHDVKLASEANWSEEELSIRTGMTSGGLSAAMEERWSLSKDGKTLTVIRAGKMVYVYRKQP